MAVEQGPWAVWDASVCSSVGGSMDENLSWEVTMAAVKIIRDEHVVRVVVCRRFRSQVLSS